jgi:hypothetical protein
MVLWSIVIGDGDKWADSTYIWKLILADGLDIYYRREQEVKDD